jgi:hypothetical protein
MNKLEKMINLLNIKYPDGEYLDGDLWQKISDLNCSDLPCMDISLEPIDESYYYGVDFSNEKKVYILFFTGSSDYFSGIWLGNYNIEFLDSMPVYLFDLSDSDDNKSEPIGNFRFYIESLLNDFLNKYKQDDEYTKTALIIKEKIKDFSTLTIDKGIYILDIMEEE